MKIKQRDVDHYRVKCVSEQYRCDLKIDKTFMTTNQCQGDAPKGDEQRLTKQQHTGRFQQAIGSRQGVEKKAGMISQNMDAQETRYWAVSCANLPCGLSENPQIMGR